MKAEKTRTVLITGGAGFIGSNLAASFLASGKTHVRILDNLSREGVARNVAWLKSLPGHRNLEVVLGDVRDARAVRKAAADVSEIYHLAAQVAVTDSLKDPMHDFEVNVIGTLNMLEAARQSGRNPFIFYTSTNKVYGAMEDTAVAVEGTRYCATQHGFHGFDESQRLDFHSPYGCSKGAADQYVRDYARIYGLPTVVFRMSCIAGPRQFGTEDQGWVAHFLYSALSGRPVTVYGNGYQVRDVLHVHDLVDAIHAIREQIDVTRGKVYNLGGGPARAISIVEMLRAIEKQTGVRIRVRTDRVRPGDQPLYISDTRKLERDTGWHARRNLSTILSDIRAFWAETHEEGAARARETLPAARALEGAA